MSARHFFGSLETICGLSLDDLLPGQPSFEDFLQAISLSDVYKPSEYPSLSEELRQAFKTRIAEYEVGRVELLETWHTQRPDQLQMTEAAGRLRQQQRAKVQNAACEILKVLDPNDRFHGGQAYELGRVIDETAGSEMPDGFFIRQYKSMGYTDLENDIYESTLIVDLIGPNVISETGGADGDQLSAEEFARQAGRISNRVSLLVTRLDPTVFADVEVWTRSEFEAASNGLAEAVV